ARTKHDEADEAVRNVEPSTERLESMVATAIDQLALHDNRIADLTRQIAEIDEEIRKVTQASDPQEERTQLNRRRGNIGKVLQDGQAAETTAAKELAGVAARLGGELRDVQQSKYRGAASADRGSRCRPRRRICRRSRSCPGRDNAR